MPPSKPRKPMGEQKILMPWRLPGTPNEAVFALQALAKGIANAGQQQIALAYIKDQLCATDRMSFYPGADDGRRASDFAEGKRWIGLQIERLLKLRPNFRETGLPVSDREEA